MILHKASTFESVVQHWYCDIHFLAKTELHINVYGATLRE